MVPYVLAAVTPVSRGGMEGVVTPTDVTLGIITIEFIVTITRVT